MSQCPSIWVNGFRHTSFRDLQIFYRAAAYDKIIRKRSERAPRRKSFNFARATGLLIFFSITTASATTFGGDLLLNFHFTLDFGETCFQNFFQKFVRILVPLSASRCYTNMDTSLHIENALGQALCPLVLKAPRRLPKRSFSVQAGVHVGATS